MQYIYTVFEDVEVQGYKHATVNAAVVVSIPTRVKQARSKHVRNGVSNTSFPLSTLLSMCNTA